MNSELTSNNKDILLWHALRLAHNTGEDNVPWNLVVHAFRQGLGMEIPIYPLQKDYETYPELQDLVHALQRLKAIQ